MPHPRQISFWKHHPSTDQKAITLAHETLIFQQQFNCDYIKITPAGTWQAVCQGAIDEVWENDNLGRRKITTPNIQSINDWLQLPDIAITNPLLLQEMIKACALVYQQTDTSIPIFCTVFCPISQAIQMSGLETFLKHIQENPAMVLAGLEIITKNTEFAIDQFKKAGAKGIYFVTQHMRHGALSPDIYKNFGEKFDAQCLNNCQDLNHTIFHIHGEDIYLATKNLPSNCILHYESCSQNPVIEVLRPQYPHQIMMGIPVSAMAKCNTEDEIKSILTPFLQANKSTNIISANCVIPLDFSDDQLLLWIKVGKAIKA